MREKLFDYVANQYGINPDYPFSTAANLPHLVEEVLVKRNSALLRHVK